jgi:hypothetical protein
MATYVNDLRLKEIATGDEAGTWGTSTNTNLELIGEALGYGTQNCFASDADATTTVADGATDPARAMYFKVTSSATLTATRTLTIAPNTISRVMLIENATTGSQSITISQGSGSTVTIASGAVKMVYLDGAGAGGAVVEALADLELPTVTVADLTATTADINAGTIDGTVIGGSTPAAITGTTITGTSFVSSGDMTFGDSDKAIFGAGSDLQIYHDGSDSYITHTTGGNFFINDDGEGYLMMKGSDLYFRNPSNVDMIHAQSGGFVKLYHNAVAKLATTSTGIDVTGTVTADGLTMASGSQGVIGVFGTSGLQLIGQTGSDNIIGTMGANEPLVFRTVSTEKMRIASNGDISFYEDTGTTAKFSWSSANETISIGTGASSTATISAYSRTVSASLPSALRIIENTGASSYWDIGSTGGASNNLNFYANANTTPKMTLTGAGNVGIGESNPASPLDIHVATDINMEVDSNASVLRISAVNDARSTNPAMSFQALSYDFRGAGGIGTRAVIDSSGNVGIGGTPTTHRLEVKSDNNIAKFYSDATATELKIVAPTVNVIGLYTGTADALMFGTADTERMRIDSSGNLLVGKTASAINTDGVELLSSGRMFLTTTSLAHVIRRKSTEGALIEFQKDTATVGSIGNNTDFYIASQDGTGVRFSATQVLPCSESGATQNGSRDLGSSGARFQDLYLSGGVYLGGTGAANLLDDYEEGTFTPSYEGLSSAGTTTYTYQQGYYTKVGNIVTVIINLGWTNATGTGQGVVSGLPFQSTNDAQNLAPITLRNDGMAPSGDQIQGYVPTNNTKIYFDRSNLTTGISSSVNVDAAVGRIIVQATYRTGS